MSLAPRLKWYLESHGIDYGVVHHEHSNTTLESARKAHIPGGLVAKCVLLEDERGYLLALIPASCHLSFDAIARLLDRRLELASEGELSQIFSDCETGAVPAAGMPYNIPMLVDDSLLALPEVYFEGGDHEDLVHLDGEAFQHLVDRSLHGRIRLAN